MEKVVELFFEEVTLREGNNQPNQKKALAWNCHQLREDSSLKSLPFLKEKKIVLFPSAFLSAGVQTFFCSTNFYCCSYFVFLGCYAQKLSGTVVAICDRSMDLGNHTKCLYSYLNDNFLLKCLFLLNCIKKQIEPALDPDLLL